MLCQPSRKTSASLWSYHAWCVWEDPTKNQTASGARVQCHWNVGMWVDPSQRNLSRHPNVRGFRAIRRASQPAWRLLWWSHQCRQAVPSRDPGSKEPLHRFHFLVPLGEQDVRLPQRTSSPHLATGSHRHPHLLWGHPMPSPPPRELYHPVLPYRHAGKLTFLSVPLVSKKKWSSLLWRDLTVAPTPTSNAPWPGRGAPPNCTKPSSWGARSSTSTKCGSSTRPVRDTSKTTSTPGWKSSKKPAGGPHG